MIVPPLPPDPADEAEALRLLNEARAKCGLGPIERGTDAADVLELRADLSPEEWERLRSELEVALRSGDPREQKFILLDSEGKEVVFPGPADSVEAASNDGFDSGTMFIMAEADGKPIPDGCRYEDNPHSEGSPEHKAWADEWIEASGK